MVFALGKGVTVATTEEEPWRATPSTAHFGGADARQSSSRSSPHLPEDSVLAFVDGKPQDHAVCAGSQARLTTTTKAQHRRYGRFLAVLFLYRRHRGGVHGDYLQADRCCVMEKEGRPFKGCAAFRSDADPKGPRVIEYNARFGDPETQAVLSRLDTDLFDISMRSSTKSSEDIDIKWADNAACCVCMASGGYPKALREAGGGDHRSG